jgi:hypothetical protein
MALLIAFAARMRVALFIGLGVRVGFVDAQNMYKSAREAFGWEDEQGHFGNFRPLGLGRIMATGSNRKLVQVRVYTGIPSPKRDSRGHAISQRRLAAWVSDGPDLVQVFPRTLRYPPPEGREKGVDVELAIDLVELALEDKFDVAVIASADTDLVPALQLVVKRCPDKSVETVTWEAAPGYEGRVAEPLDIPGGGVKRRKIKKHEFDRITDRRNFVTGSQKPESLVGSSRWNKIKSRFTP